MMPTGHKVAGSKLFRSPATDGYEDLARAVIVQALRDLPLRRKYFSHKPTFGEWLQSAQGQKWVSYATGINTDPEKLTAYILEQLEAGQPA